MYYLQSRYYNPEWGRFINSDALGGQVGELLSHNIFAYTKNNPVNLKDSTGFRSEYTLGEETDEMREASIAEVSVTARNNSLKNRISNGSSSSFNAAQSGGRNFVANGINVSAGGKIVRAVENAASYFNASTIDVGGGLSRYAKNLGPLTRVKGVLGANIGSAINSGYDLILDIGSKKYFAVSMDVLGFVAGCGAGIGIEIGAAFLVGTVGLSAIGVGIGAFAVTVGVSMLIDYGTSKAKDSYYGGV